ncbi:SDR family NAD(P)-dependent oxidoreductase [Pseudoroseicyclus sp. CXY001]|uniref:SDR family NAD(P)-dependent oxidoreductase n=1 Tax=Pseudoroseicyclus sp. CXY001 TaxID=3242492 RepID=UPI003570CAB4
MTYQGKVFVVTGAGSGIGRELVRALMAQGAKVAAVDLRREGLETLGEASGRLSLHPLDISDRDAVAALPAAVEAALGPVDGLINNAGIIQPFVPVSALDMAVIDRLVSVNLMGPVLMTKAFLPALMARPKSWLVNVASMGGFIPFPGQTIYSATKAAVKLMSEGLYAELMDGPVSVSVVMPGAVDTNIVQNSGLDMPMGDAAASKAVPAPEAAKIILDGVAAGRLHILVGSDARSLWALSRIAPARAIRMIQRKMAAMTAGK